MKNILIADTQFLIIEAFRSVINSIKTWKLTGIAKNTQEIIQLLDSTEIDLLITDTNIIEFTNLKELQNLRHLHPKLAILVMSNHFSKSEINELFNHKIHNIILKTALKEEVINSIEHALRGEKFLCSQIQEIFSDTQEKKQSSVQQLSNSEIEIVRLIAEGLTTKEIAMRKNLSFHTIITHRKNIFRKVEVNNASELLMYAMKNGFFDLEYYI